MHPVHDVRRVSVIYEIVPFVCHSHTLDNLSFLLSYLTTKVMHGCMTYLAGLVGTTFKTIDKRICGTGLDCDYGDGERWGRPIHFLSV